MNRSEETIKRNAGTKDAPASRRKSVEIEPFVEWEGRRYKLEQDHGIWRIRSGSRRLTICYSTGMRDLKPARDDVLRELRERAAGRAIQRSPRSLQDLVDIYKALPKRAGAAAQKLNVTWLAAIVRDTLGKTLADARIHDLTPRLWMDYMAFRQGGTVDLATRRKENTSINTAVRCACSILIPRLRPLYAERGIHLAENVTVVQWLPELDSAPEEVDEKGMLAAWAELRATDINKWRAIGLARFAGLRRKEISFYRGDWLEKWKGGLSVVMRDRPDQSFLTKTGRTYRTYILNAELLADLQTLQPDELAISATLPNREEWFERSLQQWLRPFMPKVRKPLHRLRGLYADQANELAGVKAASEVLGHTTTRTTTDHYLSETTTPIPTLPAP